MTESGFVKGQSDNLPRIDAFMMTSYFASNPDFTTAEVKGVKALRSERESYGDSAIGYVQVKRDGDICIVKGRITPEHNVRQKYYGVSLVCNEREETISSVQCEDCSAHLGGCKHAIAFLAWLHRRSEDPPTTSTECYWKKSKLSTIGTSLKFIKAKDICGVSKRNPVPKTTTEGFLTVVKNHCNLVGDTNNHLMKFYKELSNIEKLSIHYLLNSSKSTNPLDFIEYCRLAMSANVCEEAALATRDQNNCPLWHELRYGRITASKAYDAAHCKVLDGSLTESILGSRKLRDTEAMKRGRLLEIKVIKEVEKFKKIKINQCGLKLNAAIPIMGASPDGESSIYSIEIKCPTSEKAMARYIGASGNQVTSKYMAQVQLQMHFFNKPKALFCVAHNDFESTNKVTIIEVDYNRQHCENLLEKCTVFWNNAIFPKLST